MKELVFSVANIFNSESEDGALKQYDCKTYHIPAYQRGYKWGSDSNGAVSILLSDLKEAFEAYQKGLRSEYYLQYITVKRADSIKSLEVIDGQQRLTTLSIILSVFSMILKSENLSLGKLQYAIRNNFFKSHIYEVSELQNLASVSWEDLISKDKAFNKQDIFYLHSAIRRVHKFLNKEVTEKSHGSFYNFLRCHVMLIVNSVEPHVISETVFRNLNSNQVPLTEADLVKGYLITKIGRNGKQRNKVHFREILEFRANLGRKWDEMSAWCNRPDVKAFYFSQREGIEGLLRITALMLESNHNKLKEGRKEDFHLFNFYHRLDNLEKVFNLLKENFNKLVDWYGQDDIYNLIGYCRFAKGNRNNVPSFLQKVLEIGDTDMLLIELSKTKSDLLPDSDILSIRYGGDEDHYIHSVLLQMSVFPKGMTRRFDFYRFEKEKWTLEHIFPQSPEGKKYNLTKEQRELVLEMIGTDITEEIRAILNKDIRSEEEKKKYYDALKKIGTLNSIGNMCLLSGRDNTSNGNKFFKEKRMNVLKLIQEGSFVPKHTFDVFSQMIDGLDNLNSSMWTKEHIENHCEFIERSIQDIKKEVSE